MRVVEGERRTRTCSSFPIAPFLVTVFGALVGACGGELGRAGLADGGGGAETASGATGSGGAVVAGAGGSSAGGGAPSSATVGAGGTTSTAGGAVASSAASGGAAEPPDPCLMMKPSCPGAPPASAGEGLKPIDRCAFSLVDANTWTQNAALVSTLAGKVQSTNIAGLLGSLNRIAVPISAGTLPGSATGFVSGFRWNDGDNNVAYWIPQGLTGSADSVASGLVGGHHVVLVSWYYDKASDPGATYEKGARLALVDTSVSPPKYRLMLLVEPVAGNPPSFKAVTIHAGGIAWFGDYLYVAHTSKGFRVFDLAHVLSTDPSTDSIGYDAGAKAYFAAKYSYVVPQVGHYTDSSACNPLFSFVGLDRSEPVPALISGEYCEGINACATAYSGRLYRWPLDPATGLLGPKTSFPAEAFYMGEKQVQGAVMRAGTTLLSSSAPVAAGGELYVIPPQQPRKKLGWVDTPEDLYQNLVTNTLWGLSEASGARYVFSVKAP